MTPNQEAWHIARAELSRAVRSVGYPEELAELLAKQLGSPKAMSRMASYLLNVRPRSMEMIADEMLAICSDTQAWREKISSREAQASYSAWLNSDRRTEED